MPRMPLHRTDSIIDCVGHYASTQPQARACTFLADGKNEEIVLTYAQLYNRATAMGRALPAATVGKPVLLLFPSGVDFVVAFFACLYAGAIAVPANVARRSHHFSRLCSIIRDADASLVLTTPALVPAMSDGLRQVGDIDIAVSSEQQLLAERRSSGKASRILLENDDIAFLQYTSGSTGDPKGVMVSHRQLLANLRAICGSRDIAEYATVGGWLPQFHDMGLIGTTLLPLSLGGHNPFIAPLHFIQRPERWLQLLSRYRVEVTAAPNFALDLCARLPPERLLDIDLSSLSALYCGAEPVRATTLRHFQQNGARIGLAHDAITPCYGMAEATLMVSAEPALTTPYVLTVCRRSLNEGRVECVAPDASHAQDLVRCGQSAQAHEVIVVDPDTNERCPVDRVGELWLKGPSNASGYWANAEATTRTFDSRIAGGPSGYLRTGDLGFVLGGGIYLVGRIKELIIVRGRNYYPVDIEVTVAAALEHSMDATVTAFADDRDGGEVASLIIEVPRQNRPSVTALAALASLAREVVLRTHELLLDNVVIVGRGAVPRTSSGKVQRVACASMFGSRARTTSEKFLFCLRSAADVRNTPGSLTATSHRKESMA
jgi:acyl-CoA synthetase (AMP-forming)/AMP-acid ligase II